MSPRPLGSKGGAENVTVTVNQLPSHSHQLQATTDLAAEESPAGNVPAQSEIASYSQTSPYENLSSNAVTNVGGSRSHTNLMPFLCIHFIIALVGIYPSEF